MLTTFSRTIIQSLCDLISHSVIEIMNIDNMNLDDQYKNSNIFIWFIKFNQNLLYL